MRFIHRVLKYLTGISTYIAALIVAFMFVSITINIFLRSSGHSFYGLEELNGYLMPWICFLSIPIAIREKREISIDLVYQYLSKKIQSVLDYFNSIISVTMYTFVNYWSIRLILSSYKFKWRTVELAYPIWMLQLCLVIGFTLYALENLFFIFYGHDITNNISSEESKIE